MLFQSELTKKLMVLVVAFLGISSVSASAVAGNIKRSCKATYWGYAKSIKFSQQGRDKNVNLPHSVVPLGEIAAFSAEAGCGQLVPNRCRKRARDKLMACAKAHANSPNNLPTACAADKVKSYPVQNLTAAVQSKVCSRRLASRDGIQISEFLKKPYELELVFGVSVRGSDDCGYRKPGTTMVGGEKYPIQGNKLFLSQPLMKFKAICQ